MKRGIMLLTTTSALCVLEKNEPIFRYSLLYTCLFKGFPLVPASIHAVARKKYFDDK